MSVFWEERLAEQCAPKTYKRWRCATRKIPYLTRMLQKKTLTNRIYGLGFTTRKYDRESIVNNCVCVRARALIISWLTRVCVQSMSQCLLLLHTNASV